MKRLRIVGSTALRLAVVGRTVRRVRIIKPPREKGPRKIVAYAMGRIYKDLDGWKDHERALFFKMLRVAFCTGCGVRLGDDEFDCKCVEG